MKEMKKRIDELEEAANLSYSQENDLEAISRSMQEFRRARFEYQQYLLKSQNKYALRVAQEVRTLVSKVAGVGSAFRALVEHLHALSAFFGTANLEKHEALAAVYLKWRYAVKSLILLHQLLNPLDLERQQAKFASSKESGERDLTQVELGAEYEQSDLLEISELPKLSRLMTKESAPRVAAVVGGGVGGVGGSSGSGEEGGKITLSKYKHYLKINII